MKNKLFLDDERKPWNDEWFVVKNYQDFVNYIEKYFKKMGDLPTLISLDHDLHHEHYDDAMYDKTGISYNKLYKKFKHPTGVDCAKWLCEFCIDQGIKIPKINIHSKNPVGSSNIANVIMNYKLFYYEESDIITPKVYESGPPNEF